MSFEYLVGDINDILKHGDLETISAKGVRKELKIRHPALDVKAHKVDIDQLIVEAFNNIGGETNGHQEESHASSSKPVSASAEVKPKVKRERSPPPTSSPGFLLANAKKIKTNGGGSSSANGYGNENGYKKEETDEEIARRLHAEMNSGFQRATRGGGADGSKSKAKKSSSWGKKKSTKFVDSDDDESTANGEKKKRAPSNTGFNKPWALSDPLADILGANQMSRPQVTKQLWVYIKANELQDPMKRTDILPDAKLRKVFDMDRLSSFQMAKYIGKHLYPVEAKAEDA